jgi:[acyl-carrier-protein] S-malonyltransferase
MQECCDKYPGTMAAVLGIEREAIEELCGKARANGPISVANLNSPGQIVVSGAKAAVENFMAMAQEASARVIELQVAGAFHSELMKEAGEKLETELAGVEVRSPSAPVVANVDAGFSNSPDEIKAKLVRQVSNPVLWQKCMEAMIASGIRRFYEIGPGKVLAGLARRIDRDVRVTSINSISSLEKALV